MIERDVCPALVRPLVQPSIRLLVMPLLDLPIWSRQQLSLNATRAPPVLDPGEYMQRTAGRNLMSCPANGTATLMCFYRRHKLGTIMATWHVAGATWYRLDVSSTGFETYVMAIRTLDVGNVTGRVVTQ